MKRIYVYILIVVFLAIAASGCGKGQPDPVVETLPEAPQAEAGAQPIPGPEPLNNDTPNQSEETDSTLANPVIVNEKSFSIEEINTGIKNTFNNVLYLHDGVVWLNKDSLLNQDVEYELYFEPNDRSGLEAFIFPPKIYIEITNMQYPEMTEDGKPQFYMFGIDVTEWGLRSDFYYAAFGPKKETFIINGKALIHLGSYTMRIDEIIKPQYETMDDDWKENVKSAIRLYMDKNDFYVGDADRNLASGNYHVYVQKFFKSDLNSYIIFEHENGDIYIGFYYIVHEVSGDSSADLNHVELEEYTENEAFRAYLEKIRLDPAVSMEYSINP